MALKIFGVPLFLQPACPLRFSYFPVRNLFKRYPYIVTFSRAQWIGGQHESVEQFLFRCPRWNHPREEISWKPMRRSNQRWRLARHVLSKYIGSGLSQIQPAVRKCNKISTTQWIEDLETESFDFALVLIIYAAQEAKMTGWKEVLV